MMDAVAPKLNTNAGHDVKAEEVRDWASSKWPLDLCQDLADSLNKMRWAGEDSRMPKLKRDEYWVRDVQVVDDQEVRSPWRAELDPEAAWEDELEDLFQCSKTAAAAARSLAAMLPAWLKLLDRLQHDEKLRERLAWMYPESMSWASSDARLDAVKSFAEQLSAALPHFDFPLFNVRPRDHRKRKRPKDWHMAAVLIARHIIRSFKARGLKKPRFSKSSIVTYVILSALRRQGYKVPEGGTDTIADLLSRRSTI
jgi:hypothetical protein